jgi:hypothetical protein
LDRSGKTGDSNADMAGSDTAFIPLHDCTVRLSTITMVGGSHRWQEIAGDLIPHGDPEGHMSFHHCHTYHGIGHNRSGLLVRETGEGRSDYADPDYCPVLWSATAQVAR